MASATLAGAYHVRVKERYNRKHVNLDSFGNSIDFLNFVKQVLDDYKNEHYNDKIAERIAMSQRIEVNDRVISGRILVGDYGQACNVINASDAETVFKKTIDHADALPFYFRLEVPKQRDEALLLIEKSRKTSPTSALRGLLQSRFAMLFPDYTLTIDPVLPEAVFEAYLNKGKVQKISFIKMGLPKDIADILETGHQEVLGKTELVVTAARNHSLPIKKSLFKSADPRKAIQDVYELKDLEYDNIKVDVRLGRNRRSVDLGRKYASPLYDLSNQVTKDGDGISTYESISQAFDGLANDIKEGAYATSESF